MMFMFFLFNQGINYLFNGGGSSDKQLAPVTMNSTDGS